MDSATTDQTHDVELRAVFFDVIGGRNEIGVLEEGPVGDGDVDAGKVLIDDFAGT